MHRTDDPKFYHPHAPRIAPRLGERGEREADRTRTDRDRIDRDRIDRERPGIDPDFAAPVPARPRQPEY